MIAVNTNLAAAAGALGAMVTSWFLFKKPDTSFTLNGALAGLVAITAGCDALGPVTSLITGLVGGGLVVFSVLFFDKLRVDDPVGAVSVHGVCGAWGTLAVGLLSAEEGLLFGNGVSLAASQLMPKFVPWAAYVQTRDGRAFLLEQSELSDALLAQSTTNPDKIEMSRAIGVMENTPEIRIEFKD